MTKNQNYLKYNHHRKKEKPMKKHLLIFSLITIILTSCTTTISSLRQTPSEYNGKQVRLQGDVTETFRIPATGTMIYLIYDGTGTIPVFTINKRRIGQSLNIKAMVFAVATKGVSKNVDIVIDKIIQYLKDNDIIKGKFVDLTGRGIAKLMKVILAKSEGSYLLVEI